MIVWRKTDRGTEMPEFLDGCPNVVTSKNLVWVSDTAIKPQVPADEWEDLADGWQVAIYGDLCPDDYRRKDASFWAAHWIIEDLYGRQWWVPVLVGENGAVACNRRNYFNKDGTWSYKARDDRQRRALEFAQRVGTETVEAIGEVGMIEGMVSVIESCYFLDALTIGRLALIDTVLMAKGPAVVANLLSSVTGDGA